MQLPLQITFHGIPPSTAIEAKVREKAAKLERFFDRVTSCRVVIEAPHQRHQQGTLYRVRVDVTLPGGELVVSRDPQAHHAHEDVYVAIRDAFDAAARRIEDHARRRRGATKVHESPLESGRVARLVPEEDHGFLETAGGDEVYFHRNSVLGGDFETLAVGTEVRFTSEQGKKGRQATTVRPIVKRRARSG